MSGEARRLTVRELERLSDLLGTWSEFHTGDGRVRDNVGEIRAAAEDEIEERQR